MELMETATDLRNALLIHNPNAGGGGEDRRNELDEARRILAKNGIEADLAETTGPGDATDIAMRAGKDGRQLVIACGGDGTLNEVVNGLAHQQNGHRVPLALLPGGTANILAKELTLPWDIPQAAERLVRGTVREIALGARYSRKRTRKSPLFPQRRWRWSRRPHHLRRGPRAESKNGNLRLLVAGRIGSFAIQVP